MTGGASKQVILEDGSYSPEAQHIPPIETNVRFVVETRYPTHVDIYRIHSLQPHPIFLLIEI